MRGVPSSPMTLLLAFPMAKGRGIVPSRSSWAAAAACAPAAPGMDVSEVAGDEGNFVVCRRARQGAAELKCPPFTGAGATTGSQNLFPQQQEELVSAILSCGEETTTWCSWFSRY